MRIQRMTSLDPMLARDLHAEQASGQPPSTRARAPKAIDRRSMLAGLGVASAAAITALTPGSAKASWGGGWGGWGGWGCNDPEDVVYGLMGALEMLDAEELADWLHQDVIYRNTGMPDIVGGDAVAQYIGSFEQIFEPLAIDVVSIMSQAMIVCTERIAHFVVRQDSPIGNPGAELYLKSASWYEIKQGKVFRWSDYWDTQSFATLGIPLPA